MYALSLFLGWASRVGEDLKQFDVFDVRRVWVLAAAALMCAAPLLSLSIASQSDYISETEGRSWRRACTIHAILSFFYLADTIFDRTVTGAVSTNQFVYWLCLYYLEQGVSSTLCRLYFQTVLVSSMLVVLDEVFVVWLLMNLLRKTDEKVWTFSSRAMIFYFVIGAIFMHALLFVESSMSVNYLYYTFMLLSLGPFLFAAGRILVLVEGNISSGRRLTIGDRRNCVLIVCVALFWISMFNACYAHHASGGNNSHYFRDLATYRFVNVVVMFLVSLVPWRIHSKSFIDNRRHMDSKLDFISKMSFAIRQKFQVISCDAETFLNQLKQHQQQGPQQEQGPTDNLREMVAHMVDVMEACNNCTTVLQDFSVCEKIINGDTRGTSRPTPIFPLIKDFLTNFYVEHNDISLRIFSREDETLMALLSVNLDPDMFVRSLTSLLNAAITRVRDIGSTVRPMPPVVVDLKPVYLAAPGRDSNSGGHGGLAGSSSPSLFFRIELRGGYIDGGVFQFFDEKNLDKASAFIPAFEKDSGLGFWICRELIRVLGGSISLQSAEEFDVIDPITQLVVSSSGRPQSLPGHIEEPCCLVLDLPVVENEGFFAFIRGSATLSSTNSCVPSRHRVASLLHWMAQGVPSRSEKLPAGSSVSPQPPNENSESSKVQEPDVSPLDLLETVVDLKFLVVDDSISTRKAVVNMLKKMMKVEQIVQAENGSEAINLVREAIDQQEPFDIVLMDFHMPGVFNGPKAVEIIREIGSKSIVIGNTADDGELAAETFISHGADRVLVKPVTYEKLLKTIKDVHLERIVNLNS